MAREKGFIQRKSKLSGRNFVEMCMLGNLQSKPASQNDYSAYLIEEHQTTISKEWIDERINKEAVDFMKALLRTQM